MDIRHKEFMAARHDCLCDELVIRVRFGLNSANGAYITFYTDITAFNAYHISFDHDAITLNKITNGQYSTIWILPIQ